jgi:NAD(P)-dependent dehydrogenase (short-subunit alcohol dehydrogenase family)
LINTPLFSLTNKSVLITGASSGIGRQCAICCSQFGANVILIARNKDGLIETYNNLSEGNHLYYSQNITEYDALEPIIEDAVSKSGKISGFIHSAGIELTLPLKTMTPDKYNQLFSVNVISGLEIARILSKKRHFNENGASFVFISSVKGTLGDIGNVGYCASKGALITAVKALSLELAKQNIRVNSISPGIVKTEMVDNFFNIISAEAKQEILNKYPLGIGQPSDIACACVFLLSDGSRWITGSNLIIDGGYSAK